MRGDGLRHRVRQSDAEWAFIWFMRFLSLIALASGVYYWIRLIGLQPGLLWRFDLMPWLWQTVSVGLAILLPIAATGLWMRAPWGSLLWFIAALTEISIYSIFTRNFENRPLIAAFYIAAIVIYISFRVWLYVEQRRLKRVKAIA